MYVRVHVHVSHEVLTTWCALFFYPEPIIMEGSTGFRILDDNWTAVSDDDGR